MIEVSASLTDFKSGGNAALFFSKNRAKRARKFSVNPFSKRVGGGKGRQPQISLSLLVFLLTAQLLTNHLFSVINPASLHIRLRDGF